MIVSDQLQRSVDLTRARQEALELLLSSSDRKRLIVAGPGTGKTYAFREVLSRIDGERLAITFIRNLVEDLRRDLGDLAEVQSFHGYCKNLLYNVAGLSFFYYPAFKVILAEDLDLLDHAGTDDKATERVFMNLDLDSPLMPHLERSGDYYKTVGYTDSVFRAWKYLDGNPSRTPVFAQIVVDEYQDFSLLEASLIQLLADKSPVLIVGDDDQALYDFKHASVNYIRDLATDWSGYKRFELPFCSRCTEVMVEATHTLIARAQAKGLLRGRIHKAYVCFLPEKQEASDRFPKLLHADCSVQSSKSPYLARYIRKVIEAIPNEEIEFSRSKGYPTAMVIGPAHYLRQIESVLAESFADIRWKPSYEVEVNLLDGHRHLMRDARSRLGWRILCYCDPPEDWAVLLRQALEKGEELADLLPQKWKSPHLQVVRILRRIKEGSEITRVEQNLVEGATLHSLTEVRQILTGSEEQLQDEDEDELQDEPSILLTTMTGSKGLQAEHVFVVGFGEGSFPQSNSAPTDEEVCKLLVALTRGRQSCHLVTCGRFAGKPINRSVFLDWLSPHLLKIKIDASTISELGLED